MGTYLPLPGEYRLKGDLDRLAGSRPRPGDLDLWWSRRQLLSTSLTKLVSPPRYMQRPSTVMEEPGDVFNAMSTFLFRSGSSFSPNISHHLKVPGRGSPRPVVSLFLVGQKRTMCPYPISVIVVSLDCAQGSYRMIRISSIGAVAHSTVHNGTAHN